MSGPPKLEQRPKIGSQRGKKKSKENETSYTRFRTNRNQAMKKKSMMREMNELLQADNGMTGPLSVTRNVKKNGAHSDNTNKSEDDEMPVLSPPATLRIRSIKDIGVDVQRKENICQIKQRLQYTKADCSPTTIVEMDNVKETSNDSQSLSSSSGSPLPREFLKAMAADPSNYPAGLDPRSDEAARLELKKLSLDLHGTFMNDFDPEKSKRELRKMNRRIHSKGSSKNQLYDDRGILIDMPFDLCDCLSKECPGCHFPCPKCESDKCGSDCRCNRKYIIDMIEVEGTDTVYHFPL